MLFSEAFQRFLHSSPVCVMYRAVMENVFAPAKLDAVFDRSAVKQYTRELLFSTLVEVMSLVVCRASKTVHAAYVRKQQEVSVSIRAVYDKLSNVEPCTSRALVQHTAEQARVLIDYTNGCRAPLLEGYRVRILDGNHLSGSEHRLGVLRRTAAGALPGQSLALLDPQYMVIDDLVPCEDGHAQERSLLTHLLPSIHARDLLIDDRNFCTLPFLFQVMKRGAYFITRQHARMPWKSLGKPRCLGRCATGRVYEEPVELRDPETGKMRRVRRITVKLDKATRDGDQEIHVLTNLPKRVRGVKIAELYRRRWTLEQAFNELTTHLRCELNTLGYPKAALFGFAVAVGSYNLLAAVKGAMRSVHGEETMETKVSNYFLMDEISGTYRGMMIALPPEQWEVFQAMSPSHLAGHLQRWARAADLRAYPKHPRGPKKPQPRRPNAQFRHVSTAKLLEQARIKRCRKRRKRSAACT